MEAMNRAFLYALPGKTALYSIKAQKNLKILKKYGCKIPAAVSTKRREHEPPKNSGISCAGTDPLLCSVHRKHRRRQAFDGAFLAYE